MICLRNLDSLWCWLRMWWSKLCPTHRNWISSCVNGWQFELWGLAEQWQTALTNQYDWTRQNNTMILSWPILWRTSSWQYSWDHRSNWRQRKGLPMLLQDPWRFMFFQYRQALQEHLHNTNDMLPSMFCSIYQLKVWWPICLSYPNTQKRRAIQHWSFLQVRVFWDIYQLPNNISTEQSIWNPGYLSNFAK